MPNTSTIMPSVPHTIECGQCDLRRPFTARHCEYCKLCIDNLDHHCPWYVIVRDLVFHISFLIYSFIFPLIFKFWLRLFNFECSLQHRSGKCIGEKNIKAFYWFTSLVCFQMYYLIGAFIYYIIFLTGSAPGGTTF